MAFGNIHITKDGIKALTNASDGEILKFTHIAFGEGEYSGSYLSRSTLVSEVMRIPVTNIARFDEKIVVECDWNSRSVPRAFYFREIGLIGNTKLCYYDNAESDAEWIDPDNTNLTQSKRIRLSLQIGSDVNVFVELQSGLYALECDLEETNEKVDDLEEEMKTTKKSVSDGKELVAEAITEMGMETAANLAFALLAEHILGITPSVNEAGWSGNKYTVRVSNNGKNEIVQETTLGGNAEAAHVLEGKTFSSDIAGRESAGSMANQGAKTASLNCGSSYTIPAGYHNGSGKVTANTLASQTSANATASQILKDKTAWVNGSKVTGSMYNFANGSAAKSVNGYADLPGVSSDYSTSEVLTASRVFMGTNTDGVSRVMMSIPVSGYYQGGNGVQVARESSEFGDASAGNVLTGKTFTSESGIKVTGTMANKGAVSATVKPGGSYTIPAGYHNGSGKVTGGMTEEEAAHIDPTASSGLTINDIFPSSGAVGATYIKMTSTYQTNDQRAITYANRNLTYACTIGSWYALFFTTEVTPNGNSGFNNYSGIWILNSNGVQIGKSVSPLGTGGVGSFFYKFKATTSNIGVLLKLYNVGGYLTFVKLD